MPKDRLPQITDAAHPTPLTAAVDAHLTALASRHYAGTTLTVRRVHLQQFCAWATARDLTTTGALTPPFLARSQRHLLQYRQRNGQSILPLLLVGLVLTGRSSFSGLSNKK